MEEANEKMEALKKAYAEIIFNTTKEAAAKIMVAERKAYQFQKEMFQAKQDSVSMLLRLKNMMDSKISEAENASFHQRRKIQELEEQVHKAEYVANDLRAELKEVKEELEKVKNRRVQPLHKQMAKTSATSDKDASQENQIITTGPLSSSNRKNAHLHQRHTIDHCTVPEYVSIRTGHRSNSPDENYYAGNPDLLSIMRRIKEPQLYRSGCTQRIRAFERNRLNGKTSPIHTDNQSSCKKNKVGKMGLMKRNRTLLGELLQKGNSCDKGQDPRFFRVPCRKRGTRSRKARTTLGTDQVMKTPVGTALSHCETFPCQDNITTKSSDNPSRVIEETDNLASVSPSNPISSFDTTNMDSKLGCALDVQTDAEVIKEKGIRNGADADHVLINKSLLSAQENQNVESSEVPDSILDLEKDKMQLVNYDTKDDENCEMTIGTPAQPVDDKFLKFTFRRKRKRASLSNPDESEYPENSVSKKRSTEIQSNGPEPANSSLTVEPSRDDRRLMQVARQLISLKDKKWC